MLQIINTTKFLSDMAILSDLEGIDTLVVIVKATFDIAGSQVVVSKNQLPIVKSDEYWNKSDSSSLKYASDISLQKPSADIVMNGHAYAPEGKKEKELNVLLSVGNYSKVVKVFGDRYCYKSLGLFEITDPLPFVKIPLIYENAYGGKDFYDSNENKFELELRNPVGCGFNISNRKKEIKGLKMPNILNPEDRLNIWVERPEPAGFGFIAPFWKPRTSYVGTYNEKWQKNRAPFLPEDFDPRFFNCAHPDLISKEYFHGGEKVFIKNASPNGIIQFDLPALSIKIIIQIDANKILSKANADTLLIEPDNHRFCMTWRASMKCNKKTTKIQTVEIICEESDSQTGSTI